MTVNELEEEVTTQNEKIGLISKSLERHHSAREINNSVKVPLNQPSQVDEIESLRKELHRTKELLALKEEECNKELLKQNDSIEEELNTSISNKDALLSELEKTSLLKELEKVKELLSQSDKSRSDVEIQLLEALSKQEELEPIKEQLALCMLEKERLTQELTPEMQYRKTPIRAERSKFRTKEMAADELQHNPRPAEAAENQDEYVVVEPRTLHENTTPGREGAETNNTPDRSAIVPSYSKFDSLKNRYLRKVKHPPNPIHPA